MQEFSNGSDILYRDGRLTLRRRGRTEFVSRRGVSGVVVTVAVTAEDVLLLLKHDRPALGAAVIELPGGMAGDEPGHVHYVLAIELLVAAQALDMLAPLKTSPRLEKVKAKIRRVVPYLEKDRVLSADIEAVKEMVRRGEVLD